MARKYRVTVGPLGEPEKEEKVPLSEEKAMRATNFMREHGFRFASRGQLRDFFKGIMPLEVATTPTANTSQPLVAAQM